MTTQPDGPSAQDQVAEEPGLVDDSYAPEGLREHLEEETKEAGGDASGDLNDSSGSDGDDQQAPGLADGDREGAAEADDVSPPAETDTPPGVDGTTEAPD